VQKGPTRVKQQCNYTKHILATAFVRAYVHLKIVDTRVRDARWTLLPMPLPCHVSVLLLDNATREASYSGTYNEHKHRYAASLI
jgi:hypothetical protein